MKAATDPVGPGNDAALARLAKQASLVVAAWGNGGAHLGRAQVVKAMVPNMHVLRLTKEGNPWHPLYCKASLVATPWT